MGAMAHVQNQRVPNRHQQRGGEKCCDHPACEEPSASFDRIRAKQEQQENGDMDR